MTEYWKSKPKYLCKYCDIFITDDKPSRAQHENGMRHKGNKDKYIKDLYRKGAQDAKDKVDLERQLAAIGAAATSSFDSGGSDGPVASTSGAGSRDKPARPAKKWTGGMSNYSTAAQLGLTNEETAAWDAEVQAGGARIPRANDAAPGQWTVVARAAPPAPPTPAGDGGGGGDGDEEEAVPTFKSFKRERIAQFDDDLYDPGAIQIKRRRNGEPVVKRESETPALLPEPEPTIEPEPAPAGPRVALPTMHFGTRYAGPTAASAEPLAGDAAAVEPASEVDAPVASSAGLTAPEPEDAPAPVVAAPSAPSLFKKRKGANAAPRRPAA